ncbi:hypothetical protein BDW22DRAFT_1350888 [Trametopsis cervina]|nr:hypothetical protein BDW22DRAFT_1350888 [Trametopsis cervina]
MAAPVNNNPALSQDIIRLLHTENTALRVQIQDLETKLNNAHPPSYEDTRAIEVLEKQCQELREERDSLRVQIQELKESPCKDIDHIHAAERVNYLTRQLADVSMQKKDQEEQNRIRTRELEGKCRTLEQEMGILHMALQQSQALASRAHIDTRENPSSFQRPHYIPASIGFDVDAFLSGLNGKDVTVKPKLYKGPFSNVMNLRLPKKANDLMTFGSMRYSQAEIIWKDAGSAQFLAFGPMHVFKYNASNSEGAWERAAHQKELTAHPGQRRDIFTLHDHAWHYYGTYECVGAAPLLAQKVEQIGSAQMMVYAEKRTLLDSERAPASMKKLIHNMYAEGVLRIECFGFKRTGFNEPLNTVLLEQGAWNKNQNQASNSNADSNPTSNSNVANAARSGAGRSGTPAKELETKRQAPNTQRRPDSKGRNVRPGGNEKGKNQKNG